MKVLAFAAAALGAWFMFPIFRVCGSSMEPALSNGDIVVCIRCKGLRRGDVAVFRQGGRILIKRVSRRTAEGWWMVGDNSAHSIDSRHFGAVPDRDVLGRMLFRG